MTTKKPPPHFHQAKMRGLDWAYYGVRKASPADSDDPLGGGGVKRLRPECRWRENDGELESKVAAPCRLSDGRAAEEAIFRESLSRLAPVGKGLRKGHPLWDVG